jgi:hypothetical protein
VFSTNHELHCFLLALFLYQSSLHLCYSWSLDPSNVHRYSLPSLVSGGLYLSTHGLFHFYYSMSMPSFGLHWLACAPGAVKHKRWRKSYGPWATCAKLSLPQAWTLIWTMFFFFFLNKIVIIYVYIFFNVELNNILAFFMRHLKEY